jgi:hypothetical protein
MRYICTQSHNHKNLLTELLLIEFLDKDTENPCNEGNECEVAGKVAPYFSAGF